MKRDFSLNRLCFGADGIFPAAAEKCRHPSAQRTEEKTGPAETAGAEAVQPDHFSVSQHPLRDTDQGGQRDFFRTGERRVAGHPGGTFFSVDPNQTVKNQSSVRGVQKKSSRAEIFSPERTHLNGFAIAQGRGHARPSRPEGDGRILVQKGCDGCGTVRQAGFRRRAGTWHGRQLCTGRVKRR